MARRETFTTVQELFGDITAGNFKPAYYFFGSEDYRIVEAEKFLAHQFLPDRQLMTNYHRLNGRKTSCADLLAELSTFPMLGERQVIGVSDIQSYKPTEVDRILGLLKPPDPNRIVVFSTPSARTPKKNSAIIKKLGTVAVEVEFRRLTSRESANTIRRKLTKAGLEIDEDALQMLIELVAGNRGALETEVDKLIDFKDAGSKVDAEDIRKVSAGFQVYSIFNLAEEIVKGDSRSVLQQVHWLIADGNRPSGILYFIGQHFLLLYLAGNGKPLPPSRRFLTGKFREQAARFENQQLESILREIADTDAGLRRKGLKPEMALEVLVVKLLEHSRR
jgi:DNA polymerase-3 subunit delta